MKSNFEKQVLLLCLNENHNWKNKHYCASLYTVISSVNVTHPKIDSKQNNSKRNSNIINLQISICKYKLHFSLESSNET